MLVVSLPLLLFLECLDAVQGGYQEPFELGEKVIETVGHGLHQSGRGGRGGRRPGPSGTSGFQLGQLFPSQLNGAKVELGGFHIGGNGLGPRVLMTLRVPLVEINGLAQSGMPEVCL